MCNVPEWITFQKIKNLQSRQMQGFQVHENGSKQVITVCK
jgi:hypothetical protein